MTESLELHQILEMKLASHDRFKFQEDDHVLLITNEYTKLGLKAGDKGIVWALYDTDPPAYEVIFCDLNGKNFSLPLEEEELAKEVKPNQPDEHS